MRYADYAPGDVIQVHDPGTPGFGIELILAVDRETAQYTWMWLEYPADHSLEGIARTTAKMLEISGKYWTLNRDHIKLLVRYSERKR